MEEKKTISGRKKWKIGKKKRAQLNQKCLNNQPN